MSGSFVFKNPFKRLPCGEWSGWRTTRREEFPIASQILKEHGVQSRHRPVGEQHIDLTWCIGMKCARIDDGGEDVFPIGPDKSIDCVKDGEQIYITWVGVILVFGENRLPRVLKEYVVFFNLARLHQGAK
jgi:hypothetical protein